MHDWTKVPHGIFHAFHHRWISAISDELNAGRLPADFYALPEQIAGGLGPDVLTLQAPAPSADTGRMAATLPLTQPRTRFMAETEADFYRRRKKSIAIRHVSGDRVVAIVEIVSPGNKTTFHALYALVEKALELLERSIHLLLIDPFPPGPRDPEGVHAAIWEEIGGESFILPSDQRLTLASYECNAVTRAFIEAMAVGERLPDMPLFLEPNGCVVVPLESTYMAAYHVMPKRWRDVLEG
ncbi:MAG TPA: DUF4058 family protein [Pirellulales bacterium]|nr:DUF4058 family protein [Pirellulales bacterium]